MLLKKKIKKINWDIFKMCCALTLLTRTERDVSQKLLLLKLDCAEVGYYSLRIRIFTAFCCGFYNIINLCIQLLKYLLRKKQ